MCTETLGSRGDRDSEKQVGVTSQEEERGVQSKDATGLSLQHVTKSEPVFSCQTKALSCLGRSRK